MSTDLHTILNDEVVSVLDGKCYSRRTAADNGTKGLIAPSLGDDAVRPFDEPDKDRRIAEFCAPLGEVRVSYSTGPGAGATSKNLNLLTRNFLHRFLKGRPADRDHGLG